MPTELLENGMGEIPAETERQSWKSVPAREPAVPGPDQRPAERAGAEQLLS